MATRTQRRWRSVVGLVGPDDVKALQVRVSDYFGGLQASVDTLARAGSPLPIDQSRFSVQAWGDVAGRVSHFLDESHNPYSPLALLFAGSAYERGRQLIIELDAWRDELDRRKAPNVPAPVDVPHADLGPAGALGFGMAGIVAVVALVMLSKR